MTQKLSTTDHSRNSAGLNYVYPVISRRAGGVSIGINLNPNNACNWRCIYCQVPNLRRGAAPEIDRQMLAQELRSFLVDVLEGDFYQRYQIEPNYRRISDIAISGNGEPTSARELDTIIIQIGQITKELRARDNIKLVLITNGSLMHHEIVQQSLIEMEKLKGEIWFKLDSTTEEGMSRINNAKSALFRIRENLEKAANLCPTWIQTCVFMLDGAPMQERECDSYLCFLQDLKKARVPLSGVLLYGLARPSMQPEAPRLAAVPITWMEHFASKIRDIGFDVRLSA